MHPALTYLLLALCGVALVGGFWLDGRRDGSPWARLRRFSLVLQLGAVLGAYLVLRPGRGVDGRAAIAAGLAAGQPVLVELFSNY